MKLYAKYRFLQNYKIYFWYLCYKKKVYQGEYVIDLKPNGIRLLDK